MRWFWLVWLWLWIYMVLVWILSFGLPAHAALDAGTKAQEKDAGEEAG